MSETPAHVVAVIGGAVSGSVAAEILAEGGVEVVVLEQNARPYGKIEDGLPLWHRAQRDREYGLIDARLARDGVMFVPLTRLGRDVGFEEITGEWGFSAVLLASGAWRDRPLPVTGADEYVGRGIEYQNPLIHWFNHHEEPGYDGRAIEVPDGAVVFGGGLASIDVVKVCQLVNYLRALHERDLYVDMLALEKTGIPATCEKYGVDVEDLGIRDCTLVYRRRREDMPLVMPPPKPTPGQMAKITAARETLLARAQARYRFRIQDRTVPLADGLVVEGGRVGGVRTMRTRVEGGAVTPIDGSEEILETSLIVSSIGSIPEPIEGIRMRGETFDFKDPELGVYDEAAGIFGVGNVVTGQGNIRASLLHARKVAGYLRENYFAGAIGAAGAEVVRNHLARNEPLSPERVASIRERVENLQRRVGYDGDYAAWMVSARD